MSYNPITLIQMPITCTSGHNSEYLQLMGRLPRQNSLPSGQSGGEYILSACK